MQQYIKI